MATAPASRRGVDADYGARPTNRIAVVHLESHYAIAIEGFDREAVTRALEQRGLTPDQNLDYGFYVRDPEGIPVQMVAAR